MKEIIISSKYKKDDGDPYITIVDDDIYDFINNNQCNITLKTDKNNEPKTLYTEKMECNKKFNGKTLLNNILEYNNVNFNKTYELEWLFDGDTIEFTTLNFYNTQLEKVLHELNKNKNKFIKNIQKFQKENDIFKDYGNIIFMTKNHPVAIYLTNKKNISMFNNGTLHYNITLPTKLNENNKIENMDHFEKIHKEAIKMIQWFEPILISIYNSPDPFSYINDASNNIWFSKASQRCAVSRYIGIGTYDTNTMKSGKILTIKSDEKI